MAQQPEESPPPQHPSSSTVPETEDLPQDHAAPRSDDQPIAPGDCAQNPASEILATDASTKPDDEKRSFTTSRTEFEETSLLQRQVFRLTAGNTPAAERDLDPKRKSQELEKPQAEHGLSSDSITQVGVGDNIEPKVAKSTAAPWVREAVLASKGNEKNASNTRDTLVLLDHEDLAKSCSIRSADLQQASQPLQELIQRAKVASEHCNPDGGIDRVLLLARNESVPELMPISLDCQSSPPEKALQSTPAESIKSNRRQCKEKTSLKHEDISETSKSPQWVQIDWEKAYQCFLRIINGRSTGLSKEEPKDALPVISGIISIAQKYDAVRKMRREYRDLCWVYVQKQKLWEAISQEPEQWTTIAIALKDRTVYEEAFKHLVGRSASFGGGIACLTLPETVQSMISGRARSLYDSRMRAEKQLLMLTLPANDHKAATAELDVAPAYVSQNRCPTEYNVVNIFRDFMGNHIGELDQEAKIGPKLENSISELATCDHKNGCSTVAGFYRVLHAGGNAYLRDDDVLRDWNATDFPRFLHSRVKSSLEELKSMASTLVADLVDSKLQPGHKEDFGHLTCVKVGPEDLPWAVETTKSDDDGSDENTDSE